MKSLICAFLILFSSYCISDVTHFTLQNQILAIPFAVLDDTVFYENVEIIVDQDTGFFEVISGFEVGPPTQTFEFRLKLGESVKLFNADTLLYVDKGDDSRCPVPTCPYKEPSV